MPFARAMKTTLLILTLNEIDGMRVIMPRIRREWVSDILIVDGGSTDGTLEYAREHGYRVLRQRSRGPTQAYREALEEIRDGVIINFSPDGNCIPELIPKLVAKMGEGYDMVIASRYLAGAKSEDDDAVTRFGNWLFTAAFNVLFGARYTDSLGMFRAWRREILPVFPAHLPPRAGIEPYLNIRCAKRNLKVAEIPGDEPKRIGGQRKMSPVGNGLAIVRLILSEYFLR